MELARGRGSVSFSSRPDYSPEYERRRVLRKGTRGLGLNRLRADRRAITPVTGISPETGARARPAAGAADHGLLRSPSTSIAGRAASVPNRPAIRSTARPASRPE